MNRPEKLIYTIVLLASAAPAFAGERAAPAPIAGVGIGAVMLIGIGYRALKRRINP